MSLSLLIRARWQVSLPVDTVRDPGGTLSIEGIRLGMSRTEVEQRFGSRGTGEVGIYSPLSPDNDCALNVWYSNESPAVVNRIFSGVLEIGGRPALNSRSTRKAVFERFGWPDGVVHFRPGPHPPVIDEYVYSRLHLCVSVEIIPPREKCYFWLSRDLKEIIDSHGGLEPLPSP